jgi:PAS domain S-box-containing protein
MRDEDRTREELIEELRRLRQCQAELEEKQSSRKRSEERIAKLNQLKEELLRPLALDEKLKLITDGVVKIFDADFARIWIVQKADLCDRGCFHASVTQGPHICRNRKQCLHLTASSGRYQRLEGTHQRVPLGAYKIGRVAAGDDPKFLTNNVVTDPRVHDHEWAEKLGLISFAGYRLLSARGNPVGVLALFSKQPISSDEDSLLEGLANTTAQVILTGIAEEALRESEAKYRLLFDSLVDVYYRTDKAGNITMVSPSITRAAGYKPEEVIGANIKDFYVNPEERDQFMAIIGKQGFVESFEVEMKKKEGSTLWVAASARLSLDKEGNVLGVDGIARDITERKLAEEELRRSEEKYRNLFDNASDLIQSVDLEGCFLYANPAWQESLGYGEEEIKNLRLFDIVHPDSQAHCREIFQRVVSGESVEVTDATFVAKDGSSVTVEGRARGVLVDGRPAYTIGIFRDTTERKKLEAQLRQAQKMEAVGTLAGGVAHDFNNLLQVVHGYTQMLLMDTDKDDPRYPELREILHSAKRGAELTKRLLTFSRRVESKLRPVDFNFEVETTIKLLQRTLPKMIEIELRLDSDLKVVNADPSQLEQVLVNLAVNAKDAMEDGGRLTIQTENVVLAEEFCERHPEAKPGPYILLTVYDTGRGMDKETLEHIFDPFFTTKGLANGTGLGLAMVYGIVKNHGGYIECSSEIGAGTTFHIYLPALEQQVEIDRAGETSFPQGGSEIILLIDDEEYLRNLGERSLTRFGYTVLTAPDGESGLALYRKEQHRIDLVILDLIMPGMSGNRCLEELRKLNPDVKIVISSGYSDIEPMKKTIESGARSFIAKPYEVRQILQVIREVLDDR